MPSEPRSWDQFEQMLAACDTLEWKLKFDEDHRFVRDVIYAGLTDLNTGFDSPLICHFSPEDFLTMIDRCESLSVRIIGVEVFTTDVAPPWKVGLLQVEISPEDGYHWSRRLVRDYQERSDINICASFDVPDAVSSRTDRQVYKGQRGNPTARAPAATAFRSVGNSAITTPVRMIARLHNRLQIVIRSKKMSAEPRPYICACTPGTVPPSIASVVYSLTESRSPHKWRDCKSRCSRIPIFPHYASCISDRSFPSWRCFS
jgi:hypothetical protein